MRDKRVQMRLPTDLVSAVDEFCASILTDRTKYIETLIRHDLKRRKLFPKAVKRKPIQYDCDVEDIPLNPDEN